MKWFVHSSMTYGDLFTSTQELDHLLSLGLLRIVDRPCRYFHFRTIERNRSIWIMSTKDVGMVSWAMPMDRCGVYSLTEGGFLDHLRFQTIVSYNMASRYKIGQGTSAVARAIMNEGQCQGGTKFDAKFKNAISCWFGLAAYSNSIIRAFTDDGER